MVTNRRALSPAKSLLLLTLLAVGLALVYMTVQLRGNISYILLHRSQVLLTMLLVAFACGLSTLLFQTVTQNRILTPAVMGLESLFVLLQTLLIYWLDLSGLSDIGTSGRFVLEAGLLMLFATLLYRWLFSSGWLDLHRVLLIGLVCGTLFRSSAGLMQRLMSPGEFALLQSRIFATFTRASGPILALCSLVIAMVALIIWRLRHRLDVLALGPTQATVLGLAWRRNITLLLLLSALLVAISTALVGPMMFLGLLVVNLAYALPGSWRHSYLLPGCVLIGMIMLTGGQLLLERGLGMEGTLSVLIEFAGGLLFIWLLLTKGAK